MKFRLLFVRMTTNDTEVTLDERLRRAVAAWCWRRGVSERRFGADMLGNPGFASTLARGQRWTSIAEESNARAKRS